MIRLLEFYPEHLNLNGDRGNLLVLQRRLEWAEIPVERFTHRVGQPLPTTRPDFILIGHGSPAAWRQVYADLARVITQVETWLQEGTQLLAVSSGFAALHGLIADLPASIDRKERVSKFERFETTRGEVVGYLNSDLDLPCFAEVSNLTGTLLHGPLLAKNVWLADEIIEKILEKSPELVRAPKFEKFAFVESLAAGATRLAKELAAE